MAYSNAGYKWGRGATNSVSGRSGGNTFTTTNPHTGYNNNITVTRENNGYAWGRDAGGGTDLSSKVIGRSTARPSGKTGVSINASGSNYLGDLKAAAQAAYDRNMAMINGYYSSALANLNANYDASRQQMDNNYNRGSKVINSDAEDAMRQAYINNMLSRRDLQQAMVAQGLNGGATETTRASMENNYGNARNGIDKTRNKNLADLENTYQNNLLALEQQINNAKSELEAQRMQYALSVSENLQNTLNSYADKIISSGGDTGAVQAYLNNANDAFGSYNGAAASAAIVPAMGAYYSALQDLGASSDNYAESRIAQEVANQYNPTTVEQASVGANSNNARILAAQQAQAQQALAPSGSNSVIRSDNPYAASLAQMLAQLYGYR